MAKSLKVGKGWQIARPYDIEGYALEQSHVPTTEQVSFDRNLGTFEMETFGFGPGMPVNGAIDIEHLSGYREGDGLAKKGTVGGY
jgi:hypothetical protein